MRQENNLKEFAIKYNAEISLELFENNIKIAQEAKNILNQAKINFIFQLEVFSKYYELLKLLPI